MAKIENEDIKDSVESAEIIAAGPGDLLAAARKKLKFTKADIARQLNLSPSVIEQLESNEYIEQIPDAFIRGYLRTYARAVEIDEEKIVAIYTQNIGLEIVRNYYVPSKDIAPVKSQIGSHMLWFKVLSLVLIITLLVLGWMAFSQSNNDNTASADSTTLPVINESNDKTVAEADKQAKEIVLEVQNETEKSTAVDNTGIKHVSSQPEIIVQDTTASSVEAELEFTFVDDCWVQVTDSNDEVLAVGIKPSGRRFSVNGVAPINVVLGKPRAVSLQYNNELVDLSIYPSGQIARFTLGERLSSSSSNLRD